MAGFPVVSDQGFERTSDIAPAAGNFTQVWRVSLISAQIANLFYRGEDPAVYTDYIAVYETFDGGVDCWVRGSNVTTAPGLTAGWHDLMYRYTASTHTHAFYIDGGLIGSIVEDLSASTFTHEYLCTDTYAVSWNPSGVSWVKQWASALTTGQYNEERVTGRVIYTTNNWLDCPFFTTGANVGASGKAAWVDYLGPVDFGPQAPVYKLGLSAHTGTPARYFGASAGQWSYGGTFPQFPVQDVWEAALSPALAGSVRNYGATLNQDVPFDTQVHVQVTPPLAAQEIFGTLDICARVNCRWLNDGSPSDATACYKITSYVANGQTREVKSMLLENYIDGVAFATTDVWQQLTAPQAIPSTTIDEGDVIVTEIGVRFLTISPLISPPTYPPSENARAVVRNVGGAANQAYAVTGDSSASLNAWIEFGVAGLILANPPAPPANDACADAIVISSLPYASPDIDNTASTDTSGRVWFQCTLPADAIYIIRCAGSNYEAAITATLGACGTTLPAPDVLESAGVNGFANHRSFAFYTFNGVMGDTIRFSVGSGLGVAQRPGGVTRVEMVQQQDIAIDDLYIPTVDLMAFRMGTLVNYRAINNVCTGVAFDYSKLPMEDYSIPGPPTINTSDRILVGLHDLDLIEIFDAATLNIGNSEIDFIADAIAPINHPGQLALLTNGIAYVGAFGNGYLTTTGIGGPTTDKVVYYAAPSDDAAVANVRFLPATHGDQQTGAPWPAADQITTAVDPGAPWAISTDDPTTAGRLAYISSGWYYDNGGRTVKTLNLATNAQGPNFATIAVLPVDNNVGVHGLQWLPGGQMLISNGGVVQRYSQYGILIQTYTPVTAPEEALGLVDIRMTADGESFWVFDEWTTRLWLFELDSGDEVFSFQPYGNPRALLQMAIYQPAGLPPVCPGIIVGGLPGQ